MPLLPQYRTNNTAIADSVARISSDLANPLIIPPLVFAVIGFTEHLSYRSIGSLLAVSSFFFSVLPVAFALFIAHHRPDYLPDFPQRTSRIPLYSLSILSTLIGTVLIVKYFDSHSIRLAALIFFLNLFTGFLINLRWKISVHGAALATGGLYLLLFGGISSAGFLAVISGFFLLCVVLPLILWARHHLNIHSFPELIGGVITGLLLTVLLFALHTP